MKTDLDDRARYPTGLVAEFLNIKPKTLINYENVGLIETRRSKTGRRLFSRKDVFRLELIRYFITVKRLKFASIKLLLTLLNAADKRGINLYDEVIDSKRLNKMIKAAREDI
ncbi:MAG: MerR family transcriptional regulator [Candidatus Dojkabacteria bacterium]|nr:MAG: MerR family transcriptional regulator [Candidatus Dojkabacteria bacterium]